jgi:hypothetical protein
MPRAACRANEEDDEPTSLGQFDHTQGNSALGSQKRDGRFFPRSPRTYACGARVPFPPPFPFFPFSLFFLFFSWLPENLCMRRNGTIAVDFMW